MKLGFCSISALDRTIPAVAELAAARGLDGIEITARPPHVAEDTTTEALRAVARDVRACGVEVIAYGSYLGRPELRGREPIPREVMRAAALEAPLLRVWAEPEAGDDADFREVVAALQETCERAAAHGATVVVERHLGSWADTPQRIRRLLEAVDRENFALNYQVLDDLPWDARDAQPADARRLVGLARYLHLKNYRPSPRPGGPLLFGGSLETGVLDYRAILSAAVGAGYRSPMTIEFLALDPQRSVEERLASDVAFVREILREIDAP